tara:strand:- start:578 stop:1270 length:693 start_codon:yes stop_codon:yes gene_type:complete
VDRLAQQRCAKGSSSFGRIGLVAIVLSTCVVGCAAPPAILWRAGASRAGHSAPLGLPKPLSAIATHYKEAFGPFEETSRRRHFACAATTVLSKAYLLPDPPPNTELGSYTVLAEVTTEEFPRDEERSFIRAPFFELVFGTGVGPHDLFQVRLDPTWRGHALNRLREYAAQLGADAVIEVYATGDAEYHMWEGSGVGFDVSETNSAIYSAGKLLGFKLRDVRLHGLAVSFD